VTTRINEAVLEMIYLRPIAERFERHFGRSVLMLLKPTARREKFLGFDQGWVKPVRPIDSSTAEAAVASALQDGNSQVPTLGLMLFLQFKVASEVKRRRPRADGTCIGDPHHAAPHHRITIDLRTQDTGPWQYSQHETMRRLATIRRAHVYYACPLIGNVWDVYAGPPLDSLRLVAVSSAPSFAPNETHHILFKSKSGKGCWCSDPVDAEDRGFNEWLREDRLTLQPLKEIDEVIIECRENIGALPGCCVVFVFGDQTGQRTGPA